MNCHSDNKGKQGAHNHSPLKHMLHMILCCGLPIVIIGVLPLVARFSPTVAKGLGSIAPFICPLMMLAMIPMMLGNNKKRSCCSNENEKLDKSIELNKPVE
ncbi:hypothetical protein CLHOM_03390 [Clostridium homopropionicum DSM 5847]|uniref:DUF2933 domain-containing protein n=1 Tax=Clostridium homopropionicum DSM 5847 TaxID=1121318 RepID=A0A0L6ZE08_9CLOT|nr:hypothetical protein [Clostridium homopropionicum]KOA21209.1 hypothetical protein CLHOM_03390 [Clostridium homopropionicum DSM 5847]SFG27364.1 hypothetical protein SAMN04488501_10783 [Clostridium homopropionicum]